MFGDQMTRPEPLQRNAEEQQAVDKATEGLALYHFNACPFCTMVRREIAGLGLNIELRDAQTSPYREELASGGGKVQAPCLRIERDGEVQWMYESSDITSYIKSEFGAA